MPSAYNTNQAYSTKANSRRRQSRILSMSRMTWQEHRLVACRQMHVIHSSTKQACALKTSDRRTAPTPVWAQACCTLSPPATHIQLSIAAVNHTCMQHAPGVNPSAAQQKTGSRLQHAELHGTDMHTAKVPAAVQPWHNRLVQHITEPCFPATAVLQPTPIH
jgi:hypothetical protein